MSHSLDVQSDNANKCMTDPANSQRSAREQAKQAGVADKKVSWDDGFPNNLKVSKVIGLRCERVGVGGRRAQSFPLSRIALFRAII